jgi:hypothetical protein
MQPPNASTSPGAAFLPELMKKSTLNALFVCTVFFLLSGCCRQTPPDPPMAPPPATVTTYADQLFQQGNFAAALAEYREMADNSTQPEERLTGLFGLACTQMILAESEGQLLDAVSNLEKWAAEKPPVTPQDNRDMLVVAVKRQSELLQTLTKNIAKREKQKNQLIASQKKKIAQMATTVDNLQKQLEELEAIDQNYQERKKP